MIAAAMRAAFVDRVIGRFGYRRRLARSLHDSVSALEAAIAEAALDARVALMLMTVAQQAAFMLHAFVLLHGRRVRLPREFVTALPDASAARGAVRVATWALWVKVLESGFGPRYADGYEAARASIGIANAWESRLGELPTAAPEARALFDRYTVEGMIAAATGREAPVAGVAVATWTEMAAQVNSILLAFLDQLGPRSAQSGPSAVSEAELEARAPRG